MKKNLLTLSLVGVCTFLNAQLTYVGNGALVHIQDKALVYSGGGVKLTGTAKVNVTGDMMVVGNSSDLFETDTNSSFRLLHQGVISSGIYGQLYISGIPQANITGKVQKEYVDGIHGSTARQQVALPFYNYSITDLLLTLPHINYTNSALTTTGRWNKRSVFKWNNSSAAFDQLTTANSSTSVGKPTDYYILSRLNYNGSVAWDPTVIVDNNSTLASGTSVAAALTDVNSTKKFFSGVPISDTDGDTQISLSGALATNIFGTLGKNKNAYNELYNSYLDDPFVTSKWTGDYGLNVYQQGNPFLTNIDLSMIKKGTTAVNDDDENFISNINGIYFYSSGLLNSVYGSNYSSTQGVRITFDSSGNPVGAIMLNATKQGGDITGSSGADLLVIRPMQEFIIKLNDTTPQALKFNKTRRFAQIARSSSTSYNVTAARISSSNSVTKQLAVILLDDNNMELGRTFYVVNADATTGFSPENARMQATTGSTSIYTKEEQVSGGADVNANYNLFINEANEVDFSGKEIPLVVNNANAAKLKFFLIEGGKLVEDKGNLSNGKSFYYSNNGTLTKIKSGDTFSLTNTNFTYGLFYEQPAGVLGTSELLKGQTIVAKKDQGYVVRFNKNWKQADIEVYSSVGQLLHSAKKVSTYDDYKLPLDNVTNGVYIVKIKSNDGEIVTKKVIK